MPYVNDIHSALNRTSVQKILIPDSLAGLQNIVKQANADNQKISIAGGRHAMGGQQFGEDTVLVDTSRLNKVLHLDRKHGIIEVEAGIHWPEMLQELENRQSSDDTPWGVIQTQTGASRLSLGGALSANIHGRGLRMRPIVNDVESFVLVTADGEAAKCSREEHPELFSLAIGGYGLFGIIYSVRLKLAPRRKLERIVEITTVDGVMEQFDERIRNGFLYGDFQFNVDENAEDFLTTGIFACYRPVAADTPFREGHSELAEKNWIDLLYLAHTDRREGFRQYSEFYLSTHGQIYWSDTHQLGVYLDGYHAEVDRKLGSSHPGSEMITELYVPRPQLADFMLEVRALLREKQARVIYGTVRLIERDEETFLPWARQSYACIIFNVCITHTPEGIEHATEIFRGLIDAAASRDGSFYLTYHRFARRDQLLRCYPDFEKFLLLKKQYDPAETFQSDWYRSMKELTGNTDAIPQHHTNHGV